LKAILAERVRLREVILFFGRRRVFVVDCKVRGAEEVDMSKAVEGSRSVAWTSKKG
jgi:hypothetical protein